MLGFPLPLEAALLRRTSLQGLMPLSDLLGLEGL